MPSTNASLPRRKANSPSCEPHDAQTSRPAGTLRREGAVFLRRAGIEDAPSNAERLLQGVLRVERIDLLANPDRLVSSSQARRYFDLLQKRAEHFPLQYLVGRCGFMDFELKADSRALIPRPETELLVETAIERLAGGSPLVCDVGTGSGCIAIALARAIPSAKLFATDISMPALELAQENARECGVADRITFLEGDLLSPVRDMEGRFDAVCSNPPYVSCEEYGTLAPEIREHEPREALVAAEDGVEFHRRLIEEAPAFLKEGGWLLIELPAGKRERVESFLPRCGTGIRGRRVVRDYAGMDRVLVAERVGR